MSALGRVCVVMLSAVGDTVHALPVLTALKRHDPGIRTTWIIQPGPATLIDGHPAVDQVVRFDRRRGLGAFLAARRDAGRQDVAFDLQTYFKAGLVTWLTHSTVKLGFNWARSRDLNGWFVNMRIPAQPWRRHMQDQYLEFLDIFGVPGKPVVWDLGPREDERAWQSEFLDGFERPIAPLVIGSTRAEKNWPAAHWAAVADALYTDFGLAPVMVGGESPAELAMAREIASSAHTPVGNALGSGLRRLVSILDGAALIVSLDTGPLHMAVALDRPVISLIGYNDPVVYGPYVKFHDLIVNGFGEPSRRLKETRPSGMSRVAVADVLDRIQRWHMTYRT